MAVAVAVGLGVGVGKGVGVPVAVAVAVGLGVGVGKGVGVPVAMTVAVGLGVGVGKGVGVPVAVAVGLGVGVGKGVGVPVAMTVAMAVATTVGAVVGIAVGTGVSANDKASSRSVPGPLSQPTRLASPNKTAVVMPKRSRMRKRTLPRLVRGMDRHEVERVRRACRYQVMAHGGVGPGAFKWVACGIPRLLVTDHRNSHHMTWQSVSKSTTRPAWQ